MLYVWMGLYAAGVVALDQFTKYLTVEKLDVYEKATAIPGLFHFTYVQNRGAAFSSFEGARWVFVGLFLVFTLLAVWEFSKKKLPFTKLERWCIVSILAGGLGNVIDRVINGYVIDMIEVDFVNFAVFNVADCFITCGCILLMVSLVFFNKKFWKEEKK